MRLWTIQDWRAYLVLRRTGRLVGDWQHVEPYRVRAYRWVVRQMARRRIELHGRPPIWGWTKKPDLRQRGHLPPRVRGVRLELDVPDDHVLCSNFDAWHAVLNDHALSFVDAELDPGLSRRQVEQSWEGIFDLGRCAGAGYGDLVQATFRWIDLCEVARATEFVAR